MEMPADYFDEELANFDTWYGGERGRALLACIDGVPAAGAVLREWREGDAEMRRLYVRPDFRRRGLARALVRAAVAEATAAGYRRLLLVTSDEFEGAVDLYSSEGFARIDPYRPAFVTGGLALARDLRA
jgi:GNAT superfamily N-acetyltransferase